MKNFNNKYIAFIIVICQSNILLSQIERPTYKDTVYNSSIHTVLLYQENNQLSYPIIYLGSEQKLTLRFDDFNTEIQEYYYTIIHCNAEWEESDLMQSEYLHGFFQEKIVDYNFSFNTLQEYTHYKLTFPNDNVMPTISGNYIIKIFNNDYHDDIILTRRFMILDEKVNIQAEVKRSTLIDEREYKQEVDFIIHHPEVYISNPYNEIKVVVKQNNREDNLIKDIDPLFIKKDQLIYDYHDKNTFYANNEFRHLDIKSIRFYSDRIKTIKTNGINTSKKEYPSDTITDTNKITIELHTDISRAFEEYITIPDLNGNFLIEKQEAWEPHTEAEYVNTNFYLLENREISYGDIYLIGRMTNWEISNKYKMKFNKASRRYELSILLKQGYYNYLYVLRENNNNKVNTSFIEGSHYESNNEYYIYVYYREIGGSYDQLIGYIKTSSNSLF